jgi:dTDP-4-amino-4,6-dideoxygalactose transaminase
VEPIYVTKSFLPPIDEYKRLLDTIWNNGTLTNNGPLLQELENKLIAYLSNPYVSVVNNGTVAIQIAIKALNLKGSVITTPFSYCATTTSLLWENLEPIFVDIKSDDLNIDPQKIENAIKEDTVAILATHVYGNPCEVEKIEEIANRHNLKVIYDAAHAFGVSYQGKSLLNYGDIATCSFHSTKVFHTIEGGCIVSNNVDLDKKMRLMKSFGHIQDDYFLAGINGKNSEFHAAMGLVNLNHLEDIINYRKAVFTWYDSLLHLGNKLYRPFINHKNFIYNYAYYPVVFEDADLCNRAITELNKNQIYPRRYFYPSLNQLPYLKDTSPCPISESIAYRVISLPLSTEIKKENIESIAAIINACL